MKKFEKFLFSYSILAVSIVLISFGVMSPRPLNLISIIGLLPIVFYFWIRLTSPASVNAEVWSIRFLSILVVLSALGVYGFYLAKLSENTPNEIALKSQLLEVQRKNQELTQILEKNSSKSAEIETKKETKNSIVQGESIADLLAESSPSAAVVQKITLKTGLTTADVYQNASSASNKVGGLESKVNYPYLEKNNGWYKVALTSTVSGWVNNSQVQEVY